MAKTMPLLLFAWITTPFLFSGSFEVFPADKTKSPLLGEKKPKQTPKVNNRTPPEPAPVGMVWIPGGECWMGSPDFPDAQPVRLVYVDGFWMDKTEVTNEQFAAFVKATGYVTEAEKPIDPKQFPNAPKELLHPWSFVFHPPAPGTKIDPKDHFQWWKPVKGACWKSPEGAGSNLKGRGKHPVVHISWNDAVAYCKWAKKRLPTEAEWEFAARGGLDRKKYCWGDELLPQGKWMCNVWQGDFPMENKGLDGFKGTAPVGSFPANGFGLVDMAGNAWEWCSDLYRPDYYEKRPARNPQGPDSSFDPNEPGVVKHVQRGGSFLCSDNYCKRYWVGGRGLGEKGSAANNSGFRCVLSPKK